MGLAQPSPTKLSPWIHYKPGPLKPKARFDLIRSLSIPLARSSPPSPTDRNPLPVARRPFSALRSSPAPPPNLHNQQRRGRR